MYVRQNTAAAHTAILAFPVPGCHHSHRNTVPSFAYPPNAFFFPNVPCSPASQQACTSVTAQPQHVLCITIALSSFFLPLGAPLRRCQPLHSRPNVFPLYPHTMVDPMYSPLYSPTTAGGDHNTANVTGTLPQSWNENVPRRTAVKRRCNSCTAAQTAWREQC